MVLAIKAPFFISRLRRGRGCSIVGSRQDPLIIVGPRAEGSESEGPRFSRLYDLKVLLMK